MEEKQTSLGKTNKQIIYELILSLNQGNTSYADYRVNTAIAQYKQLITNKIIIEEQ